MGTVNLCLVFLVTIFISYSAVDGQGVCYGASYGILGVYTECKDCVTANVCNNERLVKSRKCDEATPYCYRGICGNVRDPGLSASQIAAQCPIPKKYECTSSGLFPDPLDCTRYLTCKDSASVVTAVSCPSGFVFSDVTGGCKKQANPTECAVVDCKVTMDNGVFSPYSLSRIYYALCIVNPNRTAFASPQLFDQPKGIELAENQFEEFAAIQYDILVFRCAKGAQFDGNPNISTCVFKCLREGYQEYSLDVRMYYDCKTLGGNGVLKKCPPGTAFDKEAGLCVAIRINKT